MLNPARTGHRNKFVDLIEEQLKTNDMEQDLANMGNNPLYY